MWNRASKLCVQSRPDVASSHSPPAFPQHFTRQSRAGTVIALLASQLAPWFTDAAYASTLTQPLGNRISCCQHMVLYPD